METFDVLIFDVLFGHLWTFDVLFLTFDKVIFDVLTLSQKEVNNTYYFGGNTLYPKYIQ
jgi:hypothetical protein